jgi:hypothetical protein
MRSMHNAIAHDTHVHTAQDDAVFWACGAAGGANDVAPSPPSPQRKAPGAPATPLSDNTRAPGPSAPVHNRLGIPPPSEDDTCLEALDPR